MPHVRPTATTVFVFLFTAIACLGGELPIVHDAEFKALADRARGVIRALKASEDRLPDDIATRLETALKSTDPDRGAIEIQKALDQECLIGVTINPEGRVRAIQGEARARLAVGREKPFLVKIHNEAGVTSELEVRLSGSADLASRPIVLILAADRQEDRVLSGDKLEYRVVRLTANVQGKAEAKVGVDIGPGSRDLGSRSEIDILFDCRREAAQER